MRNITKVLPFVLILLISCNHKNEKVSDDNEKYNLEFQNNLTNSPKLFSKFWVDMTEKDFQNVVDTLKKERKINQKRDSLFYKLDGHTMFIDKSFENGKLKKITLLGDLEPIWFNQNISPYNLFKEKYNLPNLTKENKYFQKNTIPNPDYKPLYSVYLKNGMAENVTNYLIDNRTKKYRYERIQNENISRLALAEVIELDKKNNIKIIIKDVPSQNDGHNEDIVFSLEDWENEIPFLTKRKYRIGKGETGIIASDYKSFNDQKKMETIGNYLIRKNSKYITKGYFQKYNLKVTYITDDYYNKEQKQKIDSENSTKKLRQTIEEMNKSANEKRKKEALEEI